MLQKIAFVSEAEYPFLAAACAEGVVGKNYAEFLKLLEIQSEELKRLGLDPIKVHINPVDFSTWCGNRKATRKDLVQYSEIAGKPGADQNDPSKKSSAPSAPPITS